MNTLSHMLMVARRAAAVRLLFFALPLVIAEKSWAQFTNPITTTPVILQDGFGPAGDLLPYGGQEYCVPTAGAMSLSYLGVNGFNQIGPSSPTAASELNLVQVLSGLSGTDPLGGTLYSTTFPTPSLTTGIALYLAAEGISTSNYSLTVTDSPTVSTLASLDQPGTVVMLGNGYYDSSGNRTGGHMISLVGQQVNAQGQSSPNTIVVNNPAPGALAPESDVPANSLQYLNTISTSGNLTGDGAIQLDPNQYPGFWGGTSFVVEQAIALSINTSQKSVNNPTPATWTLPSGTTYLNLNGGTLPVLAPIAGTGGIKIGVNSYAAGVITPTYTGGVDNYFGVLQTQATNTSTGASQVCSGTWVSTITSGVPFGTGDFEIWQGTLALSPIAGSSSISLSLASGSGNTLHLHDFGAEIALNPNGHSSLTLTIGGNTNGTSANLTATNIATLVLAPGGGTGDLGVNERIIVNGTAGNLPTVTNGIVSPSYVAQNNDSNASGDFLTYGANGFAQASYTKASVTPINSAGSSAVFLADINQTVPASTTVQVYALNAGSATVGGGSSSTLQVGTQTSGQGGIILNGGTISTPTLALGTTPAVVYTSNAGGTISSVITGSQGNSNPGLTTFGPGTLTLTGASTFTGKINVNSGILQAENTSGSATGTGTVYVNAGGTLEVTGASAKVSGSVVLQPGALLLNGGTVAGALTANSGSYIFGQGTVTGAATVSGTIGNSGTPSQYPVYNGVENITFTNDATFNNSTIYSWRLNALTDTPSEAGVDWSLLQFTTQTGTLDIGSSSSPFNFTLDLGSGVADPNSGNAFWNESHQWLMADAPFVFNEIYWDPAFATYAQGSFSLSADAQFENAYVDYTPIATPEPTSAVLLGLGTLGLLARRRRSAQG